MNAAIYMPVAPAPAISVRFTISRPGGSVLPSPPTYVTVSVDDQEGAELGIRSAVDMAQAGDIFPLEVRLIVALGIGGMPVF